MATSVVIIVVAELLIVPRIVFPKVKNVTPQVVGSYELKDVDISNLFTCKKAQELNLSPLSHGTSYQAIPHLT